MKLQYLARPIVALAISVIITSIATAQVNKTAAPALIKTPTPQQVEESLSDLLLCRGDFFGGKSDAKKLEQLKSVLEHLRAQQRAKNPADAGTSSADTDGAISGDFSLFGTRFQNIYIGGWDGGGGGAAITGMSDVANPVALVATLNQLGLGLKPVADQSPNGKGQTSNPSTMAWGAEQIGLGSQIEIGVSAGDASHVSRNKIPPKAILACSVRPTTEANAQRVFGMPPLSKLQALVYSDSEQPGNWVDELLTKPHAEIPPVLASYRFLRADQVITLLDKRNTNVDKNLAGNPSVVLSSTQLDNLVARGDITVWQALVSQRASQLTAKHRETINTDPFLRDSLVLRAGGAEALALLTNRFATGDELASNSALARVTINAEVIDLVLNLAPKGTRENLAMNHRGSYTAAQIERMLQDSAPNVVIGVLRRRDLTITPEQYDRGLKHPDKDIHFWTNQREEHQPSFEQIEAGLTHADVPTRRNWLYNKRVSLAQAQVDRAFSDINTRTALLGRADTRLSEAQLDACTIDADISNRFACVRRADYNMTQLRFQQIVSDKNGSLVRAFLANKSKPPIDLTSFAIQVLKSAPAEVQIAMAEKKDLKLSEEVLAIGAASAEPSVAQAFCRLSAKHCKNK